MADPGKRKLKEALRAFAHDAQWCGWERATLGKVDGAGQRVVHAAGRPGWVYVTIIRGDTVTDTMALNTRVRPVFGLPVWVGRNAENLLAVMGSREGEVVQQLGTSAAAATLPEAATTGVVSTRRLLTGLVVAQRQGGAYTMSVYANPFAYVYQGRLCFYPGGWLDLTSSVPGAGLRRWALVCLDPATNALDVVNGATYGIPVTLTPTQLAEVDPGGLVPLAGVNLYNGMAAIDNEALFLDARPLVSGDWDQAIILPMGTDNVSDPPEGDELDTAFGTPTEAGAGFVALLDDGGTDSAVYLVASNGASWWYVALTKAANS